MNEYRSELTIDFKETLTLRKMKHILSALSIVFQYRKRIKEKIEKIIGNKVKG